VIAGMPAPASLKRNTAYMTLAQAVRLAIQAVYFLLIARALGPEQYGAFAAVVAALAIAYPFVGNGTSNLMVQQVARDPRLLPQSLGNALLMTLATGVLVSLLVVPACLAVLPRAIPACVILLVAASDLIISRFVDVASLAFQAVERLGWTATLNVFASLMRLAGIAGVLLMHRATAVAWSVAYLAGSVACAVVAVSCLLARLTRPKFGELRAARLRLREGFYFSTSLSAQTIYNDVDKAMLARLATLEATGIYAAAYRLVDMVFMPVRALLAATYPSFFRRGSSGIAGSLAFATELISRPLAYSAVVSVGLTLAAPLVPMVLGADYASTAEALRWLALLPLLKTCHYFAADALTGAGHQGLRTLVQLGVAGFNVLLNLRLIPAYSWRGAAWSSLASDGLLAGALWSCALALRARSARGSSREADLLAANRKW